jgi:hypothetical protein
MYAKDTDGPIRVRLIKLYEFPMGTICCHGLTFSDAGRLSPSHYFGPPKITRPVTHTIPIPTSFALNCLLSRLFFMLQPYQLVVILLQVVIIKIISRSPTNNLL